MYGGSNFSLADVAAVTRGNNDGGFGDGNGWWILIILFAIFGGWGNGGYGGNGGNYGTQAEVQRGFDTSFIVGKLDRLGDGLCSLGYDQLAQMNALGRQIDQNAFAAERAANQNAMFMMQQFNAAAAERAACCCKQENLIQDVRFDMERNDCSIKNLLNDLFQRLQWQDMQNAQMLTQLINQKFCDLTMQQKDATIAQLTQQLAACNDQKTAQWVVNQLSAVINPPVVGAYPAANPHSVSNWGGQALSGNFGGNYNNGCGCGQNWNNGCCG